MNFLSKLFKRESKLKFEIDNLYKKINNFYVEEEELFPFDFDKDICCRGCKYGYKYDIWLNKNSRRAHRLAWLLFKVYGGNKRKEIENLKFEYGDSIYRYPDFK